jgi:hypothetical protein
MSAINPKDTDKPQTAARAATLALFHAKDFLEEVDRVKSIIDLMDRAITQEITEARLDDEKVGCWVPEVFATNVAWLFEKLEVRIGGLRENLKKAGIDVEHRI